MNIDLTHPELFTIEQLQTHLRKFLGLNLPNDKYELIELFYKYVVPLPQRTFRDNHWGVILSNNQRQLNGHKRSISPQSDTTERLSRIKLRSPSTGGSSQGVKHESDRGIYTITMQKSANKSTPPIKLKRPTSPSTANTTDPETNKRRKSDQSHT